MKKKKTFFWIIGGGLLQIPLIKEVKALGYNTIVSDMNPKCVCADIADIFLLADIFDIQKHIKEAFKLKVDGIKIAGVLAYRSFTHLRTRVDTSLHRSRLAAHRASAPRP